MSKRNENPPFETLRFVFVVLFLAIEGHLRKWWPLWIFGGFVLTLVTWRLRRRKRRA